MAGFAQLARAGIATRSVDGLSPDQQLEQIQRECGELLARQQAVWRSLLPELSRTAGIDIVVAADLDSGDRKFLDDYFAQELWPQLTPQTIDPAHPFPFIANRGMGLIMSLVKNTGEKTERMAVRHGVSASGRWGGGAEPDNSNEDKAQAPDSMRALLLIPPSVTRFIRLPSSPGKVNRVRFILIEDVVEMKLASFFPDFSVAEKGMFRVLRDSEVEVDDEAVDLVRMFETALKRRRKGVVIRLAVDTRMPPELRLFLGDKLKVERKYIFVVQGLVGLADVKQIIPDDRKEFQFPPFKPRFPERIHEYGGDIFAAIRAKDLVVHHPYETFDVVLSFLQQAARDPDVISIKQTLYRTSHDSPIVKELIEAAESGKTVTALIELKARFDEEANIRWARDMERAGVQVVYGFVELKTHAKVALVMRREKDGLRPYVHAGTGNYHPGTAKVYTDVSLFTADPAVCRDANRLFNFMTSLRKPHDLEKLAVAPVNLRTALEMHIRDETANARAGFPAAIWAKMNSLVDPRMINALYRASDAGVNVTLIVRGMCMLRPGVPGLSSNIVVKSLVGRFLEHSRVMAFANRQPLPNPGAQVYISSADWMTRNLDWRVEALVPVENPTVHEQVLEEILAKNVEDVDNSWLLGPDGLYTRVVDKAVKEGLPLIRPAWGGDAHQYFMTHASLSGRGGHAHGEEAEGSNGGGRAHSAAHYSAAGGTGGEVGEDDARLRHLSAFLDGEGMDV